jgi:hypothetical protein
MNTNAEFDALVRGDFQVLPHLQPMRLKDNVTLNLFGSSKLYWQWIQFQGQVSTFPPRHQFHRNADIPVHFLRVEAPLRFSEVRCGLYGIKQE